MDEQPIIAIKVAQHKRAKALARHFGTRIALLVENEVYGALSKLSPDYRGGFWHFYKLSNGGFYMAPDLQPMRVGCYATRHYEKMSADGAGVTACMLAFGAMFIGSDGEVLANHYHLLRDFAAQHAEAWKILKVLRGKYPSRYLPLDEDQFNRRSRFAMVADEADAGSDRGAS